MTRHDHQKNRLYLGLGLLIVLALASSLRLFYDFAISNRDLRGKDDVTLFAAEFQKLQGALPSQGVVTYWDGTGSSYPGRDLAQYVLTPLLLTLEIKGEWLILDRRKPGPTPPPELWGKYRVERDFGNGLQLLRRSEVR